MTRMTLVALPFWYRWRLGRRYPSAHKTVLTLPIFAFCLMITIGVSQSDRTARWRLLLMTESEEQDWQENLGQHGGAALAGYETQEEE